MTDSTDWASMAKITKRDWRENLINEARTYGREGNAEGFIDLCERLETTHDLDFLIKSDDDPDEALEMLKHSVLPQSSYAAILDALSDAEELKAAIDNATKDIIPQHVLVEAFKSFHIAAAETEQYDAIKTFHGNEDLSNLIMITLDPPDILGAIGQLGTGIMGGASSEQTYFPVEFASMMHDTREALQDHPAALKALPMADEHERRVASTKLPRKIAHSSFTQDDKDGSRRMTEEEIISDLPRLDANQAAALGEQLGRRVASISSGIRDMLSEAEGSKTNYTHIIDIDGLIRDHLPEKHRHLFVTGLLTFGQNKQDTFLPAVKEMFPSFKNQIDMAAEELAKQQQRSGRQ